MIMQTLRLNISSSVNRPSYPITAEEVYESFLSQYKRDDDIRDKLLSVPPAEVDRRIIAETEALEQKLSTFIFKQAYGQPVDFEGRKYRRQIRIRTRYRLGEVIRLGIRFGDKEDNTNVIFSSLFERFSRTRNDTGKYRYGLRILVLYPFRPIVAGDGITGASEEGGGIVLGFIPGFTHFGTLTEVRQQLWWNIEYITGFEEVPSRIKDYLLLKVAYELIARTGSTLLGAGVQGRSLSTEGLSQSTTAFSGRKGGAFSPILDEWEMMLKSIYDELWAEYHGAELL